MLDQSVVDEEVFVEEGVVVSVVVHEPHLIQMAVLHKQVLADTIVDDPLTLVLEVRNERHVTHQRQNNLVLRSVEFSESSKINKNPAHMCGIIGI